MDFWYIIAGFILMLVGWSIIDDDREYTRQVEAEEAAREDSSDLYNPEDEHDNYRPYSGLQDCVDIALGLFYMARGAALLLGGALLVVSGLY